jgi:hypothetical protein
MAGWAYMPDLATMAGCRAGYRHGARPDDPARWVVRRSVNLTIVSDAFVSTAGDPLQLEFVQPQDRWQDYMQRGRPEAAVARGGADFTTRGRSRRGRPARTLRAPARSRRARTPTAFG